MVDRQHAVFKSVIFNPTRGNRVVKYVPTVGQAASHHGDTFNSAPETTGFPSSSFETESPYYSA